MIQTAGLLLNCLTKYARKIRARRYWLRRRNAHVEPSDLLRQAPATAQAAEVEAPVTPKQQQGRQWGRYSRG